MLALLGLGIVIGVLMVVGLLKLTMREEAGGCVLVFGLIFLGLFLSMIVPQIILKT